MRNAQDALRRDVHLSVTRRGERGSRAAKRHLRRAESVVSRKAGTEDLPLHVHEFSDRLLVVTSGLGLFHYLPKAGNSRELRSVVVDAGDAVLFTRGLVHTFTAPLGDLALLSYHAPLFEFDDTRQFTLLRQSGTRP